MGNETKVYSLVHH